MLYSWFYLSLKKTQFDCVLIVYNRNDNNHIEAVIYHFTLDVK